MDGRPTTLNSTAIQPVVVSIWTKPAQLATAFFVGVFTSILALAALQASRWGSSPSRLELDCVASQRLNLNQAERLELAQLPGVGPALATRIEHHRQEHGPFGRLDDLMDVPGVGPALVARLRPLVTVQPGAATVIARLDDSQRIESRPPVSKANARSKAARLVQPVDPNRATAEELQQLPGIGPRMAQRIHDERSQRPFRNIDDLRRVHGIGPKTLQKMRPYLTLPADEPVSVAAASE